MIDRNKTLDLMREAKFNSEDHYAIVEMLLHFANLIAAEVGIAQYQRGYEEGEKFEREQCAAIADAELAMFGPDAPVTQYQSGIFTAAEHIAEAIRARNSNDQT